MDVAIRCSVRTKISAVWQQKNQKKKIHPAAFTCPYLLIELRVASLSARSQFAAPLDLYRADEQNGHFFLKIWLCATFIQSANRRQEDSTTLRTLACRAALSDDRQLSADGCVHVEKQLWQSIFKSRKFSARGWIGSSENYLTMSNEDPSKLY